MGKRYEFVAAPQRSTEWLELRAKGLGASDMAAVMGVSPYKTAYQLWAEKTGAIEPPKLGAAAQRGVLLEDAVARYYELERDVKLRKSNGVVRLLEQPRFMASLDRTIVGDRGIVEIKTSASPRWSMYPVPPEVIAQTTWQMGIVGAPWCDVAVLLGGLVFRIERVSFDEQLWNMMRESATRFLEAVDNATAPQLHPNDAAAFAAATPQASDEIVVADDSAERVFRQLRELQHEQHFLEEKASALEIVLKEAIGERAGISGNGWTIYWKQAKTSAKTDWEAVARELGATDELAAKHTTERAGSRRFVIKDGGLHD